MNHASIRLVAAILLAGLTSFWGDAVSAESLLNQSSGQTVYVPIYSHIYSGNKERPVYLAATLSIRNADPANSVQITAVDYYDSSGKLLKSYLTSAVELPKLASVRYVVKESDKEGGSGANFVVRWHADRLVTAPLIESVMISNQNQLGISFTSRGYVIAERQANQGKKKP